MAFSDLFDHLPKYCFKRHWHPQSEVVTGADSLLTALNHGWTLYSDETMMQPVPLRSGRSVNVYYFKLLKDDQRRIMPVLGNPFVQRLIVTQNLSVRELAPMESPDAVPMRLFATNKTDTIRTA
ncbi:MAG: hypothetical protein KC546_17040 [Anaerolineae bacterium]|nr:hypothetical protein [Anaerolineae bacterium]MCA9894738.1 hypothetical protein [Anaerolineae bacterium]MCA9975113.1 hypothetical protein [Anaerolineales bacterium]